MTNSDLTGNPATGLQVNLQTSIGSADSDGFQLDIDVLMPGQGVTAIFGPSGSGKTTLLRCIAGLSKADSGKLVINGDTWQAGGRFLPPHQRNIGYVFQEASLFAHLNVAQNIRYGIKRRKTNISEDEYQKILQMLGIAGLSTRMPDKLSGGERQRVAIARALVTKPKLLLMDEPLSSLDDTLKQQILPYLEQLKRVTDIPILYVTHSMQEVSRLADQVVLLQRGTVQAQGSVNEVFSQQQCVNDGFIGTVIHVTASAKDDKWHLIRFSFADNHLWLADSGEELQQAYRVRIPASDVSIALHAESHSSILNRLKATLISISPCAHPARCLVKLMVGSQPLVAQITRRSASELSLKPDMSVWVQIKSAAIIR